MRRRRSNPPPRQRYQPHQSLPGDDGPEPPARGPTIPPRTPSPTPSEAAREEESRREEFLREEALRSQCRGRRRQEAQEQLARMETIARQSEEVAQARAEGRPADFSGIAEVDPDTLELDARDPEWVHNLLEDDVEDIEMREWRPLERAVPSAPANKRASTQLDTPRSKKNRSQPNSSTSGTENSPVGSGDRQSRRSRTNEAAGTAALSRRRESPSPLRPRNQGIQSVGSPRSSPPKSRARKRVSLFERPWNQREYSPSYLANASARVLRHLYGRPKEGYRNSGVLYNGGLELIVTDPRVDPPARSCFACWEKGHNSNRCPNPDPGEYCRNCGRREVVVTNCPRCSKRHARFLAERMGAQRPDSVTGPRPSPVGPSQQPSTSTVTSPGRNLELRPASDRSREAPGRYARSPDPGLGNHPATRISRRTGPSSARLNRNIPPLEDQVTLLAYATEVVAHLPPDRQAEILVGMFVPQAPTSEEPNGP